MRLRHKLVVLVVIFIYINLTNCTTRKFRTPNWSDFVTDLNNETKDMTTKLHYEEYGSGSPILLIHGFGANTFTWRYFIPSLSKNNKIILIDLKGFGKSPKPQDNKYSAYDQSRLVCQFIKQHNLQNLTLIGHSFGGGVALLTTLYLNEKHPNHNSIKKLILIDNAAYKQSLPFYIKLVTIPVIRKLVVSVFSNKFQVVTALKAQYYDKEKIKDDAISAYAEPLSLPGAKNALIQTARHLAAIDADEITSKYDQIDIPTLIIWGKEDKLVSLDIGKRLHNALRNSQFFIIEKCGHMPHEEEPEKTLSIVNNFLQNSEEY